MEQSPPEIWRLFLKGKPMLNQNPNWQRLWIVNFEEQIVSHADGWVFKFTKIADGVILVLIGTVAYSAFLILLKLDSILIYLKAIQEFGVGK